MKRTIPIIISVILLALVIFFYYDILINIYENKKTLIGIILIFIVSIVVVSTIFFAFTSNLRIRNKKLQNRLEAWANISVAVRGAGDEVFNELPIGILIYNKNDEIIWNNNYSLEIFNRKNFNDEIIKDINEELYKIIERRSSRGIIEINNKKYDVINKSDNNFIYLFDATEREEVKLKYLNQIPALGVIYLDNLDETLASLDVSEQSSIKGEYLSAINDWLVKYDGYLRPFTDDGLIFFTYREKLLSMMEDKFDILETIKQISLKHEVRVTLSIGVASWDVEYDDLGVYAQSAIDLAEKRGGDQAVVNIEDRKIEYFGAKSDASEKSSKVSARINAETLREYIIDASNVYIIGHNLADLDSFGSMVAVYQIAKSVKKRVYKVFDYEKLDFTVQKVLQTFNEEHVIFNDNITSAEALENIDSDTLLIVVDTQSPKIIMSKELLDSVNNVVVIDHHRASEEGFNSVFSYVEPYASSTIELVMELISFFDERKIEITDLEASIMYGGLVLDTSNFTNRTGTRTFEVAQKLKELGADPGLVKTWLRKDLDRTIKINKFLITSDVYLDRFVILKSDELQDDRIILAQASEEALLIDGVDASFTIAPIGDNTVGVSARSIKDVNVQLVMEHIGGGGHLNSAAAQIKNKTVDEVIEWIKEYLNMEYGIEGEDMKVILLEDVKGRGKKDDVIKVAPGYASFLINSQKAILANDENIKALEEKQAKVKEEEARVLELMKKLKSEIESKSVTLEIQVGKDGRPFGSITTKHIADEFLNQNEILIDRRKISLAGQINSIGIYQATVNLHKDVKANFEINVIEKQG